MCQKMVVRTEEGEYYEEDEVEFGDEYELPRLDQKEIGNRNKH